MEVANFNNNRYAHDEIVAQMLSVELNGGPTSVRHNQLKSMYQAYKTFKVNSPEAKKFRRVLDFLAKAFPNKSPYLSKVNLFSLYTVASGMISKYALPVARQRLGHGSWTLRIGEERKRISLEIKEMRGRFRTNSRSSSRPQAWHLKSRESGRWLKISWEQS